MPPFENDISDLFLMNENGDTVKIGRFSEMPICEVKTDPHIDLKSMYESEYEFKLELTPESAAEMAKLQKQLDAEIIENLNKQISAVNAVILALKCCKSNRDCGGCPYLGDGCMDNLFVDAIAIAEAYNRVLASGLEMMEKK